MIKKRNPVIAAILSVITPGVGHMYAGNAKKGIALIVFEYGITLLCGLAGLYSTSYGIWALITFIIGFYCYVIVSAINLARKNKEYQVKSYNRWYWYFALIIIVSLTSNFMFSLRGHLFGYETYRIASKSMDPTLQVGDFITIDTRKLQPIVGDIIVFLYPKDRNTRYVMRVAALGNDTLQIVNGNVIRNGNVEDTLSVPESRRQNEYSVTMAEKRIPENEIFVLGDWRDNSNDGRFWGTVPKTDLIGKVTYIWYSKDFNRLGMKVR